MKRWTFGAFLALLLLNTACVNGDTGCEEELASYAAAISVSEELEVRTAELEAERGSLAEEVSLLQGLLALAHYDANGDGKITCAEAEKHGITPVQDGHAAYRYMDDRNNDGVVCK